MAATRRKRCRTATGSWLRQRRSASSPRKSPESKSGFADMQPLADGKALVEDYERISRVIRTMEVDLDKPGSEPRV